MRKLWTDHVVWKAAATRLLKNQDDIGNAVAKYYGAPAGQQLTTLLKEHITIAVDLIKAAKAGDKAAQQQADMMKKHLATTTAEVVARLTKDWDGDVRAFDAVYDHILHMADALSDGIVKQFPNKFS